MRRGFLRVALLHRNANAQVHAWDPFPARRVLLASLAAALFGSAALAAGFVLRAPLLPLGLAGGFAGILAGWMANRRSKHGIQRRLLKDHARWLVSDETVLVVQAPVHALHAAVSQLRERGDIPPAVFTLHPTRPLPAGGGQSPMIPRLLNARRQIHEVCTDLSQAARLEQGTPPTAEWILDNEYVIEGNARDVQVNLPPQFCRRLPTLTGGPSVGLPRIYDIASRLVLELEQRLDRENICRFMDACQSAGPLSIAELWALPQMLRIALIESIRDIALRASAELREREIADFWASRLIRANRRGSDQLFAILAELAVSQPAPSPYLAGQLVDHLYDEEAALVLVQGWLERTYRPAPRGDQPPRAESPGEGPDLHRQRFHQPPAARPARLARDLRAFEPRGAGSSQRPGRDLPRDGFRNAGPLSENHRGAGPADPDRPRMEWPSGSLPLPGKRQTALMLMSAGATSVHG